MKKYIIILSLFIVSGFLISKQLYKDIWTAKTYTTSTTQVDTSTVTLDLKGFEYVEIQHALFGGDSVRVDIYVDGYVAGQWINFVSDSLKLVDSQVNSGRGILLRGYGTNKIPGVERIRTRTSTQMGAAADSLSALYYKQVLIGR
jgi:hypothetical protein